MSERRRLRPVEQNGTEAPDAWERCCAVEKAERESLRTVLDSWKGCK